MFSFPPNLQGDQPSCCGQFPPDQVEVGQGEQCKDLRRILLQPPITHLPIPPQVLDHAKGMFHPGPGTITLPVKLPVRTIEPLAPSRLAVHPPVNTPGNGRLSATLTGIRLVAIDNGLLTMQALVHDDRIMHRCLTTIILVGALPQ